MVRLVLYEQIDSVAVITINRPNQRNAIDQQTGMALRDAFKRLDEDDDVDVGVVTGAGEVFSAGADLDELVSDATFENMERGLMGFFDTQTEKPLIAAIEGYAVGDGLELALFCDLRVAAESAKFSYFEQGVGAPQLNGGTQRLPRTIGLGRALDMILTGREVGAEEAYAWGLVNRVVDDDEAMADAVSLGKKISSFPSKAVLTDRRAVYHGLGEPLERGLAIESWLGTHAITVAHDGAGQTKETNADERDSNSTSGYTSMPAESRTRNPMREESQDWIQTWHDLWQILGCKWTFHIIRLLSTSNYGFNEMKRKLDGITATMLSRRLKQLQREGFVSKSVIDSSPPSTSYQLTEEGQELSEALLEIEDINPIAEDVEE